MKQQAMISGYAFAGNPLIYHLPEQDGLKGGIFNVYLGNEKIYTGQFTLPVTLNLSEIVSGLIPSISIPELFPGQWMAKGRLFTYGEELRLEVEYDNGNEESEPVQLLRGETTLQTYRSMVEKKTDFFAERFLNPEANFFLTTRNEDSDTIIIPEDELYPLAFILPSGEKLIAKIGTKNFNSGLSEGSGIYWFSPEGLRHNLFSDTLGNTLINEMEVGFEDFDHRLKIIISRAEIHKNPIKILFRNRYDIPELIAFGGTLTAVPEEGEEDSIYLKYDSITDDFRKRRERISPGMTLRLNTEPIPPAMIPRMMEMLTSREVRIKSRMGEFEVIPTGDIGEIPMRPEEPVSLSLTFELTEKIPDILNCLLPEERTPLRLFSVEHNDKFN